MKTHYVVSSIGRSANMVLFESLPQSALPLFDLYVMKSEYKLYKKEWYAPHLKSIQVFPETMDCLSKKKKWFYQRLNGNYMLFDDDLYMFVWNPKDNTYWKAKDAPRVFEQRMTEDIPALFESYNMVSCAQKGLTAVTAAKEGKSLLDRSLGSAIAGYAVTRPQDIWFNKILFTLDQPIPLQNYQKTKSSCEYLGIAFNQSWAKKLADSGTAEHRTTLLVANDALKCVSLFVGIVTDFVSKDSIKGGISLHRRPSRILTGVNGLHKENTRKFLDAFMQANRLSRLPEIFDYEDDESFQDIIQRVRRNWKAAGGKDKVVFLTKQDWS